MPAPARGGPELPRTVSGESAGTAAKVEVMRIDTPTPAAGHPPGLAAPDLPLGGAVMEMTKAVAQMASALKDRESGGAVPKLEKKSVKVTA